MEESTLPIATLLPSDTPRLDGEDGAHIRVLAQSEEVLPPILVHRATMRVIDGMHRLEAALLRGEDTIRVKFFDGDDAQAFVLAVEANIAHGLPLTIADRRAAALRVVASYPQWSDRAIARATGLSAKTVGIIRKRATGDDPQLRARVGRDGRTRPLDGAEGRLRASALLKEKPAASLRQVAAESGVSLGTVRDVRDRLARGDDPVPRQRGKRSGTEGCPATSAPPQATVTPLPDQQATLLHQLKQDPSIRCSEIGRALIRLLSMNRLGRRERQLLLDTVPEHCRPIVADLAGACADMWWELAARLAPERNEPTADQASGRGVAGRSQELTQDLRHLRGRRHGGMMRDSA